ncbi:MAG TPA: PPOX class F420-dependent oxidoreductase [Candidatus Limnocylindrales bacterium]|nr:PPOX class F420-dependent oxidoreductase [Candidatus Limnocylindrales bacterium]
MTTDAITTPALAPSGHRLRPFITQPTVLLTTFRRDGTPVGTPVSLAVDGDRAFVRTYESSGKFKRLRRNPVVHVAPSTFWGKVTGDGFRGRARLLAGDEATRARGLIERKHPWLHGILVPLGHRLTGKRTVYLEITSLEDPER